MINVFWLIYPIGAALVKGCRRFTKGVGKCTQE
jgi:hypothetical protein